MIEPDPDEPGSWIDAWGDYRGSDLEGLDVYHDHDPDPDSVRTIASQRALVRARADERRTRERQRLIQGALVGGWVVFTVVCLWVAFTRY
ncbi:hypothetical protein [Motilibacter peucedani]|uniref:hypothetical protein n=1 Tax=Motilibacter peucedani TaxID=598650 RepID=UPI000EB3C31A|nr:hypothetical protein [Motilibacter peucedani]